MIAERKIFGRSGAPMAEHVIVIVEDDEDTREFMELFLTDAGYRVHMWPARRGALAFIRNTRPHIVIMDLQMDEPTDGWQLLEELRADPATASIPAILYSADEHFLRFKHEELRALRCQHLTKPFALDHLLDHIRRLVDRPRQDVAV